MNLRRVLGKLGPVAVGLFLALSALGQQGNGVQGGIVSVNAGSITGTLPVANGGTNLTAAADDNVMVGNATTWQSKALTSCSGASSAVTYNTTTNAFGCNTITSGATIATAKKASDTSRTSATSSADPDLAFTSVAAGTYSFECYMGFTADSTSGIKMNLLSSQALATSSYTFFRAQAGTTALVSVVQNGAPTTAGGGGTRADDATGNAGALFWNGFMILPSATTLSIQWGVNSGSTAAVLKAGSWCRMETL